MRNLSMTEESKDEDRFDPLGDISKVIIEQYRKGSLPVVMLLFMIIYNLFFFSYGNGKELYLVLPIAAFILLILMNYWNDRQNRWKIGASIFFLILAAGLDLLVSVSYYLGSRSTLSLPTAALDLLAFITFFGWLFQVKTGEDENPEIQDIPSTNNPIEN